MSSSEERRRSREETARRVPFVVIPDTPSVLVTVTDSAFHEVAHAMGTIDTTLPPGIYRIEQRFGGAVESRFVEVGTEPFVERLALPDMPTATPVEGTPTTREDHRAAAVRWSTEATHGGGPPTLMVLIRNLRRGWQLDPFALEIADERGTPVDGGAGGWEPAGGQEWSAWSGELPPGGYRLRMRRKPADGLTLAQALHVLDGWTTLVFVSNGPQGPQPQFASIQMVPRGIGWQPADRTLDLALEAALSGLRQGIDLVSTRQLLGLLDAKSVNPFLGIIGAHALLLHPTPDLGRIGSILERLVHHAPAQPDIAALCTLLGEQVPPVASPPMLAASCRLLVRADSADPGILQDGSVAESAAEHMVGRGVWTTWLEQEQKQERKHGPGIAARGGLVPPVSGPAGAARRPRGADPVERVQRYVREIASVEDKSVEDVLRSMEPKDLSRRTGMPHKAVDKAIGELRRPQGKPQGE
ncbi:hypothetical protein M4V62_36370 [Streptomyces durmitorensis]|uniref:Uncharacterized protein n=1 Tax=Streptomyces durmitorensis TaxID=319947 RepID=A0ABY4Q3Y9_9ACTN|nr:hypothetical protein [Streptomyces durmitorensis]UQT60094.1 hypothetical protein M4V62_36370 [Streptomyces durmitorensis]